MLAVPASLQGEAFPIMGAPPDGHASPSQPTWVIEPTDPGEDVPPVGRSLFDQLVFGQHEDPHTYEIPFPFFKLLKKIEKAAAPRGSPPHFTVLLIPFGRSLHRHAAQPAFFQYPRILATIDADDIEDTDDINNTNDANTTVARSTKETDLRPAPRPFYLKDRLFLAYQEKAAILEVISYNEAAGRFEFQIVRNYRPDAIPQVIYANRKVCTVCHQHHAPIFPEPLWSETNAAPTIQALVQASQPEFSSLVHGVDIAAAFDAATDRANDILVAQKLWQEGCETPGFPRHSIECRATLLLLALQQGLSGKSPLLDPASSPLYERVPALLQTWQGKWPHGLWLPNPNIPNRPLADVLAFMDPPAAGAPSSANANSSGRRMHPLLDPGTPRPPLATLTFTSQDLSPWIHLLTGLSHMVSRTDLQTLDEQLIRLARDRHITARPLKSRCQTIFHAESESVVELKLKCRPSSDSQSEPGSLFSLTGRVMFEQGHLHHGTIHRLQLDAQEEHAHLRVREAVFRNEAAAAPFTLLLKQSSSDLHARTQDGNLIQSLVLHQLPAFLGPDLPSETLVDSEATLNILPDFPLLHTAVQAMIHDTIQGHTAVLGQVPFRRTNLVQSLLHHLDPPPHVGCCDMPAELPPVVLDTHSASVKNFARTSSPRSPLQLIDHYCAECHHGVDPAPPNFLHGSVSQVRDNLVQCAERIHVRLGMWQRPPAERSQSPMPPPTALPRLTAMPQHWPQQEDFQVLRQYFQNLMTTKGGSQHFDASSTPQDYAALPACLPSSSTHKASLSVP